MLGLGSTRKPAWYDWPGGVRVKLLSITTALMAEARRDRLGPALVQREAICALDRQPDMAEAAGEVSAADGDPRSRPHGSVIAL